MAFITSRMQMEWERRRKYQSAKEHSRRCISVLETRKIIFNNVNKVKKVNFKNKTEKQLSYV